MSDKSISSERDRLVELRERIAAKGPQDRGRAERESALSFVDEAIRDLGDEVEPNQHPAILLLRQERAEWHRKWQAMSAAPGDGPGDPVWEALTETGLPRTILPQLIFAHHQACAGPDSPVAAHGEPTGEALAAWERVKPLVHMVTPADTLAVQRFMDLIAAPRVAPGEPTGEVERLLTAAFSGDDYEENAEAAAGEGEWSWFKRLALDAVRRIPALETTDE